MTAAYGNMLPAAFLSIPRRGTLNIHPSLLPLYRGAAPVQRALQVRLLLCQAGGCSCLQCRGGGGVQRALQSSATPAAVSTRVLGAAAACSGGGCGGCRGVTKAVVQR